MLPVASGGATTASAGTLSSRPCSPGSPAAPPVRPEAPASFECFAHEDGGAVRGLGTVTASYIYVVDTAPAGAVLPARSSSERRVHASSSQARARSDSASTIKRAATSPAAPPTSLSPSRSQAARQSGRGASGGGTVVHDIRFGPVGPGMDTWMGTLVVPGLDFDVTPPTLSGVVNKTVRARKGVKRVRVTYRSRPATTSTASGPSRAGRARAAVSRSAGRPSHARRPIRARTPRRRDSRSPFGAANGA